MKYVPLDQIRGGCSYLIVEAQHSPMGSEKCKDHSTSITVVNVTTISSDTSRVFFELPTYSYARSSRLTSNYGRWWLLRNLV